MKYRTSIAAVTTLLSIAGIFVAFASNPQARAFAMQQAQPAEPVASPSPATPQKPEALPQGPHAYHKDPPTGPLPPTLDPAKFVDNKAAFVTYYIASKIRELLYQEPCFCYCDKEEGHKSLLDCYTGDHGVNCHVCQRGVIFAYEQSKVGKTAAEIREAMEKGSLAELDRKKYVEMHYDEYKREVQ